MIERTLMLRDQELVDFEVDPLTGEARVIDVADGDLVASLGLARDNRDRVLTTLLTRRALSSLRRDGGDILAAWGAKSPVDLVLRGHGLSLSDQFWYRAAGSAERWEDLNFFTNRYSAAIGRAFFEPWDICPDEIPVNSPDQTTDGGLRKVWIQDPVTLKSSLIKARGEAYRQEPVTEVMASIILEELNIVPFVKYSLIPYGMTFCSKCENFVDQNTEFVSAAQIYRIAGRDRENDTEYDHLIRMCKKAGIPDAGESIDNMLMADMLIGNSDRHMGNFGFIRDVETGKTALKGKKISH